MLLDRCAQSNGNTDRLEMNDTAKIKKKYVGRDSFRKVEQYMNFFLVGRP